MRIMRINIAGLASEEANIIIPEGEHIVRIRSAQTRTSQAGNEMIRLILVADNPEHALCDPIYHYILFPSEPDDLEMLPEEEQVRIKRRNRMRRLELKNLLDAAGVAYDDGGFDLKDLEGCVVKATIRHETDDTGVVQPRVIRWASV